jgi:hypothetical protein
MEKYVARESTESALEYGMIAMGILVAIVAVVLARLV